MSYASISNVVDYGKVKPTAVTTGMLVGYWRRLEQFGGEGWGVGIKFGTGAEMPQVEPNVGDDVRVYAKNGRTIISKLDKYLMTDRKYGMRIFRTRDEIIPASDAASMEFICPSVWDTQAYRWEDITAAALGKAVDAVTALKARLPGKNPFTQEVVGYRIKWR